MMAGPSVGLLLCALALWFPSDAFCVSSLCVLLAFVFRRLMLSACSFYACFWRWTLGV